VRENDRFFKPAAASEFPLARLRLTVRNTRRGKQRPRNLMGALYWEAMVHYISPPVRPEDAWRSDMGVGGDIHAVPPAL
jgi:hypothetical protein